MSTRRSTSWASVVATGIIEDPLLLPPCARPPPPKSSYIESLTKATLSVAEPVAGSTPRSQLSSPTPLKHSTSGPPAVDSNSSSNLQTSPQNFGRPFRSVWPRHATRLQNNQPQHRNNSQPPGSYRSRRHHYENVRARTNYAYGAGHPSSYRRQPRGSKSFIQMPYYYKNQRHPRNRTTFYYPMHESHENELGSQTSQHEPENYSWQGLHYGSLGQFLSNSNKESLMMEAQCYEPNFNNINDMYQRKRACVSPRARDRCQVPFSSYESDSTEWQSIAESRRVWEPLDRRQLHLDPSHATSLPSGPLLSGKASLSRRARQLMGEQVREGSHTDYPIPTPMSMPEVPIREHLCFIVNYDTHLTKSKAQLRVTNGATGDGYYVSQVPKLIPISMFLCPPAPATATDPAASSSPPLRPSPPKHRVFRPSVSYWDLLRYNQETGQTSQVDFSQDFGTVYFNGHMNQYGNEANPATMYSQMPSNYDDQDALRDYFPTDSYNYMAPTDEFPLANGATDTLGKHSD